MNKRAMNKTASQLAQQGVSIVELMISMMLGVILITGLTQIFIASQAAYALQDELSQLQENGRFAFHFMTHEARSAGYYGCRNVPPVSYLNVSGIDAYILDFDEPIQGFAGDDIPSALNALDASTSSDLLILRGAAEMQVRLESPFRVATNQTANTTDVHSVGNFVTGDVAILSSCQRAAVVRITSVDSANKKLGHAVSASGNTATDYGLFEDGAVFTRATATVFYVADGTSGRPSLWRKVNDQDAEELVTGVERMAVRYKQSNRNQYEAAEDISDWSLVSGVRISLLLSGNREGLVEDQSLRVADEVVDVTDGRMRQVMTTTVLLRNRPTN